MKWWVELMNGENEGVYLMKKKGILKTGWKKVGCLWVFMIINVYGALFFWMKMFTGVEIWNGCREAIA